MFTAGYEPPEDVQTFRLYFKSDLSPDFYYIDLELGVDGFTSPLPRPTSESRTVSYYIEMVDRSFNSVRTLQFDANVVQSADECRRRNPAVAFFTGGDPELVIRNLSGVPVFPVGFQPQGIASLGGGGLGVGTVAVVGAVAAGATAGVLAASGGDDPPASPAPTPAPTSISAVMTPPPPAPPPSPPLTACIETPPSPPVIEEGGRIKLDGRCSEPVDAINFFWELDGVRTRTEPFIEPVYPNPGVFTVRLTIELKSGFNQRAQLRAPFEEITVTVTQSAPEPEPSVNPADLQVVKTARLPFVDCENNDAFFDITVTNLGPSPATGVTLTDQIMPEFADDYGLIGCPGATEGSTIATCPIGTLAPGGVFNLSVRYDEDTGCTDELDENDLVTNAVQVTANELDPNLANNNSSASFVFSSGEQIGVLGNASFTSTLTPLASKVTGAQAVVRLNRESTWNVSARMQRHTGRAAKGFQEVEGVLLAPLPGGASWRFSFEGDTSFVRGSLRVESGEVLSREPGAVVFRLNGAPGERVRFRYRRGR